MIKLHYRHICLSHNKTSYFVKLIHGKFKEWSDKHRRSKNKTTHTKCASPQLWSQDTGGDACAQGHNENFSQGKNNCSKLISLSSLSLQAVLLIVCPSLYNGNCIKSAHVKSMYTDQCWSFLTLSPSIITTHFLYIQTKSGFKSSNANILSPASMVSSLY